MAICQSCGSVAAGRRGCWRSLHQSFNASSDRKNSMTLHVNTISFHHFAAGTTQWNSHADDGGPSGVRSGRAVRVSVRSGREHHPFRPARRRHRTRPTRSWRSTPFRSPSLDAASGTPENGGAIRMDAKSPAGTSIRLAYRRRYPSLTLLARGADCLAHRIERWRLTVVAKCRYTAVRKVTSNVSSILALTAAIRLRASDKSGPATGARGAEPARE